MSKSDWKKVILFVTLCAGSQMVPAARAIGREANVAYNKGLVENNAHRYKEAVECFTKSVTLDPRFPEPYAARGLAQIELKQQASAISDFSKAREVADKMRFYQDESRQARIAQVYDSCGKGMSALGNYDKAEQDFGTAIYTAPKPQYYLDRASAYKMLSKNSLASKDITKARELQAKQQPVRKLQLMPSQPSKAELDHIKSAAEFLGIKKYRETVREANAALKLNSKSVPALRIRAEAYMFEHRFKDATADCASILALVNGDANATALKSEAEKDDHLFGSSRVNPSLNGTGLYKACDKAKEMTANGKFREAEELLQSQVALYPEETTPYFILADVYSEDGKIPLAIKYFSYALSIDGADKQAVINRARSYHQQHAYDKEVADYTTAMKFDAHSKYFARHPMEELYSARALAYLKLKQYKKAIDDYDVIVKNYSSDDETIFRYRGDCYAALADFPHALSDYEKSISLDPESAASTYRVRAEIYDKMKKPDLAAADRKKAAELSPKSSGLTPNR